MSAQQRTYAEPPVEPGQRSGLPRLLAGVSGHGVMSLEHHRVVHGTAPLARGRRAHKIDLIEQVELAGLRGRGGGGFPAAMKMRAVAASRGRPVVLVNAAEGEPASRKDRTLTRALPHLVLDGAELAAQAIGARELIVGVCESAQASIESLEVAIAERGAQPREAARTRVVNVPNRYVAGQETALVNLVGGGPALPTFTPPMPFERGVGGRPTLIANAETLAHMALIARYGGRWFRELGTLADPGSALVTLSGAVARAGVYEIALGESLASVIDAAGGLTARPAAVLLGGYSGAWVSAEHLHELSLADEQLAPYGASLGAGVVFVLSEHACPVAELARLAGWLAAQSARQCGPCVHGLDAIATSLQEVAGGVVHSNVRERIESLAALVRGRGACAHPDGTARMVLSALDTFAVELSDHAKHGPCDRCGRPPELPLGAPAR
ncbi:MAG TPA: NADH-ubiquinone oxidoreductase-F iron-sulfur binding region domain-containing protein [Solirubrobacteraceae bacterium]|nr:NADH-ubiquinone oxidoreductase-F iron-sulfur binding region domain-containing protein [Solirubrobacteraceae bacterium]